MTLSPPLTHLDDLVTDLVTDRRTRTEALAWLRANRYTVDPDALDDACEHMRRRDRFLDRDGDPYDYLDTQPRAGLDAWEHAVARCEADYAWALRQLLPAPAKEGAA